MVNCDPGSRAFHAGYCSFYDTWGPYIWIGLAVLALILIVWAMNRNKTKQPPPRR